MFLFDRNSLENSFTSILKKSVLSLKFFTKLFVTKSILDKQVDIQKNPDIPKELKNSDDYTYRHMGNSDIGTEKMLAFLGYDSIDSLMNDVVP